MGYCICFQASCVYIYIYRFNGSRFFYMDIPLVILCFKFNIVLQYYIAHDLLQSIIINISS